MTAALEPLKTGPCALSGPHCEAPPGAWEGESEKNAGFLCRVCGSPVCEKCSERRFDDRICKSCVSLAGERVRQEILAEATGRAGRAEQERDRLKGLARHLADALDECLPWPNPCVLGAICRGLDLDRDALTNTQIIDALRAASRGPDDA